jgi:hypothetical protein
MSSEGQAIAYEGTLRLSAGDVVGMHIPGGGVVGIAGCDDRGCEPVDLGEERSASIGVRRGHRGAPCGPFAWGAGDDPVAAVTGHSPQQWHMSSPSPMRQCAGGDAAAFLGAVGYAGLRARPDALEMLVPEHVESLSADGEATAYHFRCLHCGRHLAYADRA